MRGYKRLRRQKKRRQADLVKVGVQSVMFRLLRPKSGTHQVETDLKVLGHKFDIVLSPAIWKVKN